MSLANSWKRIVAWYEANVRPGGFPLALGATPSEIDGLEKAIEGKLPDEFRHSMLLHNGGELGCRIPFRRGRLLSLDGILRQWQMLHEPFKQGEWYVFSPDYVLPNLKGPIKPVFWNPRWIPLTENGEDPILMLDLDPPGGGQYGQVNLFAEEGPREVVASSWTDFLEGFASDLEAGKLIYLNEEVQPRDQLDRIAAKTQLKCFLGPALGEDAVKEFELAHGIHLPDGYRQFLKRVGNGGDGPPH